jgi:transcriptional regulator with XRE-family HTH domain
MKVTGQTQADVAAGMRLDQTCVSDRLRGRARITLDDLDLIAAHFGITVANLVSVDYERRYYGAPGEY